MVTASVRHAEAFTFAWKSSDTRPSINNDSLRLLLRPYLDGGIEVFQIGAVSH